MKSQIKGANSFEFSSGFVKIFKKSIKGNFKFPEKPSI